MFFKHNWFGGIHFWEKPIKDELMYKQNLLNELLFKQFVPHITKSAQGLP